ncbi:MBL fold metallo-hydrolase [Catellatospora coxensis]
MVTLRFLGAAETVTGSKFLLTTTAGGRLLVDCGMFQGERELRRRNWQSPAGLDQPPDAVVLSHAHLDHCGWLPRLVRQGFTGPVYCSPWTAELAPIVLRDAAHLQEEDAAFAARHGYSRHRTPLPLFDTADADQAIKLLRPVPFGHRRTHPPESTSHCTAPGTSSARRPCTRPPTAARRCSPATSGAATIRCSTRRKQHLGRTRSSSSRPTATRRTRRAAWKTSPTRSDVP